MKLKKIAAIVMVATMTVTPMTVFAADPVQTGSGTGAGDIEGYVVQEAFDVVLPTVGANTLDFLLDPQALLAVSDSATYGSAGIDEQLGAVIFTTAESTSSGVLFAENKSSYDVTLDVDVTMTNDATNPVTFVEKSDVNTGTDLNVYFAAVPEKKYTTEGDYTTSVPSTTVDFAIDDSLTTGFTFLLNGDQSNFEITYDSGTDTYSYTAKTADTVWDSVGFSLTGLCNKDADWSAFDTAGSLSAAVAWTMTKAGTTTPYEISGTPVGDDAYGLVNVVTNTAPSIATTAYDMTAATPVAVTTNIGSGDLAATGIDSITYDSGTVVDAANYTFSSNTLTFTGDYIDTVIAATASRTYTVTFNDDASTAVTITLTDPAAAAPTYFGATTSVDVTLNGTSVSLPFNLGTNASAVTVTNVTLYVGATATGTAFPLASNTYTVSGGNLVLNNTDPSTDFILKNANTYTAKVTTSDSTIHTINIVVE